MTISVSYPKLVIMEHVKRNRKTIRQAYRLDTDGTFGWHSRLGPRPEQYVLGNYPPNYPVPAIPTHHFISDVCTIALWPGVIQYRISDEYLTGEYTGFGAVVTIEHGKRAEARYDDFN